MQYFFNQNVVTAVILEQGLCFLCSEETEDTIDAGLVYVYCHKDCWDQACCSLMKFPEGHISDKRFQKSTGINISYVCYIYVDGTKKWLLNGKRHREDGPAWEGADGTKKWLLDDKLHREDGPAEEWPDGTKKWWLNGKRHREGGPAIEWADGSKHWRLDGKWLSEQEHAEEMKKR